MEAYDNLIKNYPETEFLKDAEKILEDIQDELNKYTELENLAK